MKREERIKKMESAKGYEAEIIVTAYDLLEDNPSLSQEELRNRLDTFLENASVHPEFLKEISEVIKGGWKPKA